MAESKYVHVNIGMIYLQLYFETLVNLTSDTLTQALFIWATFDGKYETCIPFITLEMYNCVSSA